MQPKETWLPFPKMQNEHDSMLAWKSTLVSRSCMLEFRYCTEPAHGLPWEAKKTLWMKQRFNLRSEAQRIEREHRVTGTETFFFSSWPKMSPTCWKSLGENRSKPEKDINLANDHQGLSFSPVVLSKAAVRTTSEYVGETLFFLEFVLVSFNYESIVLINAEKKHFGLSVTDFQRGLIREGRPIWDVGALFNGLGAWTK